MLKQEEILKIAHLARLALTEDEVSSMGHELEKILTHLENLNTLSTEGIDATFAVLPMADKTGTRPDVVQVGLDRKVALKNAPNVMDGYVEVMQIGEGLE